MASGDRMEGLRARYNVSGDVLQLLIAGVVALIVLIAAVIALPRAETKSVEAQSSDAATSSDDGGSAVSPDGTGEARQENGSGAATLGGGSAATVSDSESRGTSGSGAPGVTSKFVKALAPGITGTTIYVGVGYSSQAAAGDRAIGAAGAAPSYDTRDVFNASIDYWNKHGGFAGRKLKALYYDYNLTTGSDTQDQSSCAYWTQDNKVFALGGGKNDILKTCAKKAGAISIGAGAATITTYNKFPHLISPNSIRFDRLGQVTVTGLQKAKYFSGKLGLVTWDDPQYKLALSQGYFPALSKFGIKVAQTVYIMVPQQIGALGDMTAAVSSAVAKFKALGIDHVIIQDGPAGVWAGTGLTFEWMNQAKSQRYYPRYGQNTYNSPGWDVLPSDQMDKAVAISQTDIDKKYDEGWKPNAFREKCFKIQADAGYPVSSSNLNDEGIAAGTCDFVNFMQRVLNNLPVITADNFINEALRLGRSLQSASVYGTNLFPGRRDGGGMVRTEDYSASCRCLTFRGPPYFTD